MVQSGGEFLYIGVGVDSEKPSDTNHQWLRTKVMSSITFPGFCVKSRQLEVTFQEVRAHLGVETQRQWSDLAIARTTPILMGLFSWTTLAAHLLRQQRPSAHRTAAWYAKPSPTFVDAIALVRRHLWLASEGFSLSAADPDIRKVPAALYHRLVDSLAYAA